MGSVEISSPVSDILYSNSFELLIYKVNYAVVIGTEVIGDVRCDHLLFSRPGVDFQIWIAKNGPPLPYKYVVTDTTTPELFAFVTVMGNWNTNPKVSDKDFNFIPPRGANKVEIQKLD